MKNYTKALAITLGTLLALASSLQADTLAQWTFNSTFPAAGPTSVTPSIAGVSVTTITRIPVGSITGVAANNTGGIHTFSKTASDNTTPNALRVSTSSWSNGGANSAFSIDVALARNNYFEFTLTAADGYDITLDSISFKAVGDPSVGSDTAERGFWLLSSIDGFTADKVLLSAYRKAGDTDSTLSADSTNFFSNSFSGTVLTSGSSAIFRFYVQTPSNSTYVYFDDLIVTGSVAKSPIPEPTTLAVFIGVLALAAASFLRGRR